MVVGRVVEGHQGHIKILLRDNAVGWCSSPPCRVPAKEVLG